MKAKGLLFCSFLLTCTTPMKHYEYADGSANRYIITPNALEYVPVKPEESSTGTYSGGDPKTVALTQSQFDSIGLILERAIANKSVHIPDRVKGSGQISVISGSERNRYILQQGCDEIGAIEGALKGYLANH